MLNQLGLLDSGEHRKQMFVVVVQERYYSSLLNSTNFGLARLATGWP